MSETNGGTSDTYTVPSLVCTRKKPLVNESIPAKTRVWKMRLLMRIPAKLRIAVNREGLKLIAENPRLTPLSGRRSFYREVKDHGPS